MKDALRRRIAASVTVTLVAMLPAFSASPAAAADAASPVCSTILQTTPGIEVDLNDDGNPEFRAPRIYDVVLCYGSASQLVTYPPRLENCSDVPKSVECMAVRITVLPAYANASVSGSLCFSIENMPRACVPFESPTIDYTAPFTMCVGYDLDGGHPCDGSIFSLE